MAIYGLRIRDAAGNVTIDISSRLPRLIYQWQISNVTLSNDLQGPLFVYNAPDVPGLANDGTWLIYCPFACRIDWISGKPQFKFYSSANSAVSVSFFKIG